MQLRLRALWYFVRAADCGNVTAAARQLHISQSAVSAAIAELEKTAGVPLFVRHHARGISLTRAGEHLIVDARRLINHAMDFEKSVHALGHSASGDVVAGCFHTLALRFMPRLLARFSAAYPRIKVHLEEGDQHELVELLLSGRIEIALSYESAITSAISSRRLASLPPCVMLSLDHSLASYDYISLKQLADEPYILLDLPHSRDYFFGLLRAVGINPPVVFRSRSHELIRGLVAQGHGFAIHNARPGTTYTYDGTPVAIVRLTDDLPPARLSCLRLRDHRPRRAVEALEEYMYQQFQPDGLFGQEFPEEA